MSVDSLTMGLLTTIDNQQAEIGRLRTMLQATQRTLWLVIRSNGGYTVERHDLEGYPGDERCVLSVNTDPTTGDKIFLAIVTDDNQQLVPTKES